MNYLYISIVYLIVGISLINYSYGQYSSESSGVTLEEQLQLAREKIRQTIEDEEATTSLSPSFTSLFDILGLAGNNISVTASIDNTTHSQSIKLLWEITEKSKSELGTTDDYNAQIEARPPISNASTTQATLVALAGSATQGNPDYEPDTLTVANGDVITVTNEDTMPHTVTSGEEPGGNAGQLFDTGIVEAGGSATIDTTSLETGEYPYHCMVHPYMKGIIVVSVR